MSSWLKEQSSASLKLGFTVVIGLSAVVGSGVLLYRWRVRHNKAKRIRALKMRKSALNIGAIFGMDVGGTLTKIIYFQADMEGDKRTSQDDGSGMLGSVGSGSVGALGTDTVNTMGGEVSDTSPKSPGPKSSPAMGLRRNNSFTVPHLKSPENQEALRKLYGYMNASSANIRDEGLSFYSESLGGRLHFLHFETRNIGAAIDMLSSTSVTENIRTIGCTGGGAHKFAQEFEENLDIKFETADELGSLIRGMHFTLTNVADECYTYRPVQTIPSTPTAPGAGPTREGDGVGKSSEEYERWRRDSKEYEQKVTIPYHQVMQQTSSFPYLVVNIGSGVSILKVNATNDYERVSGSSLGGGTYWGLCRLLTNCATYSDVLDIAEKGDASEIDMLVKDIYGGGYNREMLKGNMVASSFGKLVMKERPREGLKQEDIAIALLMMITNNIGQVSFLNARLHSCKRIFFVGSFLRHNSVSCKRLAYAIDFWSQGQMEAFFLEHDGYFGALGTFLQSAYGAKNVDRVLQGHFADEERAATGVPLDTQSSGGADISKGAASGVERIKRNLELFAKTSNSLFKRSHQSSGSRRAGGVSSNGSRRPRPGVIDRRATVAWTKLGGPEVNEEGANTRMGAVSTSHKASHDGEHKRRVETELGLSGSCGSCENRRESGSGSSTRGADGGSSSTGGSRGKGLIAQQSFSPEDSARSNCTFSNGNNGRDVLEPLEEQYEIKYMSDGDNQSDNSSDYDYVHNDAVTGGSRPSSPQNYRGGRRTQSISIDGEARLHERIRKAGA